MPPLLPFRLLSLFQLLPLLFMSLLQLLRLLLMALLHLLPLGFRGALSLHALVLLLLLLLEFLPVLFLTREHLVLLLLIFLVAPGIGGARGREGPRLRKVIRMNRGASVALSGAETALSTRTPTAVRRRVVRRASFPCRYRVATVKLCRTRGGRDGRPALIVRSAQLPVPAGLRDMSGLHRHWHH